MRNRLDGAWRALWERLGAKGDPGPPFADLVARYSEPHRAYHTLAHVAHCLDEFEAARSEARDAAAVELALWTHDAVYDPRAKDNEEKSAELAVATVRQAGLPEALGRKVADMIRASTHRAAPDDSDTRLFADVDLSILGQPAPVFDEYERQVRKEYAWVPGFLFSAGRGAILRSFLERPAIYGTDLFRGKYEKAARANLTRSLLRLG
jgi:predicted metal-dependent HD superfamily phosphohydrolase